MLAASLRMPLITFTNNLNINPLTTPHDIWRYCHSVYIQVNFRITLVFIDHWWSKALDKANIKFVMNVQCIGTCSMHYVIHWGLFNQTKTSLWHRLWSYHLTRLDNFKDYLTSHSAPILLSYKMCCIIL